MIRHALSLTGRQLPATSRTSRLDPRPALPPPPVRLVVDVPLLLSKLPALRLDEQKLEEGGDARHRHVLLPLQQAVEPLHVRQLCLPRQPDVLQHSLRGHDARPCGADADLVRRELDLELLVEAVESRFGHGVGDGPGLRGGPVREPCSDVKDPRPLAHPRQQKLRQEQGPDDVGAQGGLEVLLPHAPNASRHAHGGVLHQELHRHAVGQRRRDLLPPLERRDVGAARHSPCGLGVRRGVAGSSGLLEGGKAAANGEHRVPAAH
mmetsp:Transcript_16392/g.39991  ORF Transcript_16392/g.39991 Transcript_16392/m.39991 type:complete len:264 (+) Transcript_16392:1037-1828(+)